MRVTGRAATQAVFCSAVGYGAARLASHQACSVGRSSVLGQCTSGRARAAEGRSGRTVRTSLAWADSVPRVADAPPPPLVRLWRLPVRVVVVVGGGFFEPDWPAEASAARRSLDDDDPGGGGGGGGGGSASAGVVAGSSVSSSGDDDVRISSSCSSSSAAADDAALGERARLPAVFLRGVRTVFQSMALRPAAVVLGGGVDGWRPSGEQNPKGEPLADDGWRRTDDVARPVEMGLPTAAAAALDELRVRRWGRSARTSARTSSSSALLVLPSAASALPLASSTSSLAGLRSQRGEENEMMRLEVSVGEGASGSILLLRNASDGSARNSLWARRLDAAAAVQHLAHERPRVTLDLLLVLLTCSLRRLALIRPALLRRAPTPMPAVVPQRWRRPTRRREERPLANVVARPGEVAHLRRRDARQGRWCALDVLRKREGRLGWDGRPVARRVDERRRADERRRRVDGRQEGVLLHATRDRTADGRRRRVENEE